MLKKLRWFCILQKIWV